MAMTATLEYAYSKEIERRDKRIADLEAALSAAKGKLELYRAQHSGEYVGGVEYTQLMKQIADVLGN